MEPEYLKWLRENKPEFYKELQADMAWAEKWRDTDAERLRTLVRELAGGINAVIGLMADSRGVAGLHRNGDEAPWDELLAGGRFEDWLRDFSLAVKALVRFEAELVGQPQGAQTARRELGALQSQLQELADEMAPAQRRAWKRGAVGVCRYLCYDLSDRLEEWIDHEAFFCYPDPGKLNDNSGGVIVQGREGEEGSR